MDTLRYVSYSSYLKQTYGEKVYKLPVNLPVSCPNRKDGCGCTFCSEKGTGFEALDSALSVKEQLEQEKAYIGSRYHAKKFIAYFQNYTNTYLPLDTLIQQIHEAACVPDIIKIELSTRPDCISRSYLEAIRQVAVSCNMEIGFELGLQTANYHTLDAISRGHGLAEFIDAVLACKQFGFSVCVHVILNLPQDTMRDAIETAKILSVLNVDAVKLHSLYLAKGTKMAQDYEDGLFQICSSKEYLERVVTFLEYLSPNIVIQRIFSRIPESDSVFSNWGKSWWKLQEALHTKMETEDRWQGRLCQYMDGPALRLL